MKRVLSILLLLGTAFFTFAQEFTWKSVNNQGRVAKWFRQNLKVIQE